MNMGKFPSPATCLFFLVNKRGYPLLDFYYILNGMYKEIHSQIRGKKMGKKIMKNYIKPSTH